MPAGARRRKRRRRRPGRSLLRRVRRGSDGWRGICPCKGETWRKGRTWREEGGRETDGRKEEGERLEGSEVGTVLEGKGKEKKESRLMYRWRDGSLIQVWD